MAQDTPKLAEPPRAEVAAKRRSEDTARVAWEDVIRRELSRVSSELAPGAIVQRIAIGDIAYPRSEAENIKMAGYTLMLLTCMAHAADELPLGRVVARSPAGELPLQRAALHRSKMKDTNLRRVFGAVRTDELYYIPVLLTRVPAVVVVDFAKNREGLEVLKFPSDKTLPPGVSVIEDIGTPKVEVATQFAKEEFGWNASP